MISEQQEEQATLHALGLLDDDAVAKFERELATDPALQALMRELRDTASALALMTDENAAPPVALKQRVLNRIATERTVESIAPVETAPGDKIIRPRFGWVPWAIAALLLGCTALLALERRTLVQEISDARRFAAVPSPTPDDVFSRVAFCELEPTLEAPVKPRAAILWDAAQHKGVLRITQLAAPVAGKDYQLWAVEAARKEPVNAGLVHVDAEGRSEVTFQPDPIPGDNKVVALAISLEQAGGSPTNQGPILFLGKL